MTTREVSLRAWLTRAMELLDASADLLERPSMYDDDKSALARQIDAFADEVAATEGGPMRQPEPGHEEFCVTVAQVPWLIQHLPDEDAFQHRVRVAREVLKAADALTAEAMPHA